MKWQAKEIDLYLQAKEYVDTAILSLVPINWGSEIKSTVQMGEFITLISDELERQFKGRVLQFPSFTYLKTEGLDERLQRVNALDEHLKSNGFEHIIYVTSDIEWKQIEGDMMDTLLWIPSIPLEHMEQKYKMETLSNQIKQMLPILTNKWQKPKNEEN
ncbi:YpiF family protein [Anaerobacillus sp. CMMVII]|uniref:YpiF family protein n=1 Tax=Anaerobacillus sp. CMMVII TaxID=2755588 RepID=UPI0021B80909|nr:YpiF family protein [Anaerobacillus sp. CMMVII]MCT8138908.1 YpiF family protein [Anaerobacillus sp. CMMVII]